MSELKMMATTLWTQLLVALREDQHIAHCVVSSGPATTKVLVDTCTEILKTLQQNAPAPWLPMTTLPSPGVEVVACDFQGNLHVLRYRADTYNCWTKGRANTKVSSNQFQGWCFVHYQPSDVRMPG